MSRDEVIVNVGRYVNIYFPNHMEAKYRKYSIYNDNLLILKLTKGGMSYLQDYLGNCFSIPPRKIKISPFQKGFNRTYYADV
jgi:hypothetical protein